MMVLIPLAISGTLALAQRLFTKQAASGVQAPTTFKLGDSANGAVVPYICGTYGVSPNIVSYGNYHVESWEEGGKSDRHVVTVAYLSHLNIIGLGAIDQLIRIESDDRVIWKGPIDRPISGVSTITTGRGQVIFGWGTSDQAYQSVLAKAGYPAQSALRNICYACFNDCELNASFQIQRLIFWVKHVPATPLNSATLFVGDGINPAHALWDMLTHRFAGGRFKTEDLDIDAFNALATVLAAEGAGVNFVCTGQTVQDTVNSFIGEFDIAFAIRRGKIAPIAIRDTYDFATLPVISPVNGSEFKRRRQPFGSNPTDLICTYKNAARKLESDAIEIFSIGAGTTLNRRQTKTIDLTLITGADSASKLSARKARQLQSPADSFTISPLPSIGAALEIGDPFIASNTPLRMAPTACRVVDISDKAGEQFTITATEDVLRTYDLAFYAPGGESPVVPPLAAPLRQRIIEIPYDLVVNFTSTADVGILASRGCGVQAGMKIYAGWSTPESHEVGETHSYQVSGVLVSDYPETIRIDRKVGIILDADNKDISVLQSQTLAQFYSHELLAIVDDEVMAIQTLTPIDGGTAAGGRWRIDGVIRGILDTEVAPHAAGAVLFITNVYHTWSMKTPLTKGASMHAKCVPFAADGEIMDPSDVPGTDYTIRGVARIPPRPTNLRINGRTMNIPAAGDFMIEWDPRTQGAGEGYGLASDVFYDDQLVNNVYHILSVKVGSTVVRTETIAPPTSSFHYLGSMVTADLAPLGGTVGDITIGVQAVALQHFSAPISLKIG